MKKHVYGNDDIYDKRRALTTFLRYVYFGKQFRLILFVILKLYSILLSPFTTDKFIFFSS